MTGELSGLEIDAILERLDRLDAMAAQDLERSLSLRPPTADANALRAILLLQCARLDEATRVLAGATAQEQSAVVRFALASAALHSGQFELAAEHAPGAFAHPFLRGDAHLFHATALLRLFRNEELLNTPPDPTLEDTARGTILALQGQAALALALLEQAERLLDEAAQYLPSQPSIREQRNQLQTQRGPDSTTIECVML